MAAAFRIGAGALAVVVPCAAWLAWSAGADAWQDLIVFPGTYFGPRLSELGIGEYLLPPLRTLYAWISAPMDLGRGRTAVYELSDWILRNLPQYVFVSAVWAVGFRSRLMSTASAATAILWLSCMPLYWLAAHRDTNTYVYSMAVLSFLLWAMAWQGLAVADLWRGRLRPVLGALIVIYAAGVSIPPATQLYVMLTEWSGSTVLDLPGVRGVRLGQREHAYYGPIADFFREHTREDERIYAGLLRHDAIVVNKPIFYAVTGRASCCRYSELHLGVADRYAVQREIITDLERHHVRGIIIWEFGWPDSRLDEFKARSMAVADDGGATLLDEYIRDRFDRIAQYDEYVIMWLKGEPKPMEPSTGLNQD